jgi:hypothetical protein
MRSTQRVASSLGDMGEPGGADDIADGEDAREVGLVVEGLGVSGRVGAEGLVVGLDVALDGLEPRESSNRPSKRPTTPMARRTFSASRVVFLDSSGLPSFMGAMVTSTPSAVFSMASDAGGVMDVEALLLVELGHGLADVLVLDRDEAVLHLDDGDLGAEGVVEVAELHADGAGADDDEALGRCLLNMASRAPQILSPSNLAKGRSRATEPVAMMTLVGGDGLAGLGGGRWGGRRGSSLTSQS